MQCNRSPSHQVDETVACGMLVQSSSMTVQSCWILAETLLHAVVYADAEHPKHAELVTCPVSMLAMQELGRFFISFQELCTDPFNMELCIIPLQHEVIF